MSRKNKKRIAWRRLLLQKIATLTVFVKATLRGFIYSKHITLLARANDSAEGKAISETSTAEVGLENLNFLRKQSNDAEVIKKLLISATQQNYKLVELGVRSRQNFCRHHIKKP